MKSLCSCELAGRQFWIFFFSTFLAVHHTKKHPSPNSKDIFRLRENPHAVRNMAAVFLTTILLQIQFGLSFDANEVNVPMKTNRNKQYEFVNITQYSLSEFENISLVDFYCANPHYSNPYSPIIEKDYVLQVMKRGGCTEDDQLLCQLHGNLKCQRCLVYCGLP